jgi:hypothetical protein
MQTAEMIRNKMLLLLENKLQPEISITANQKS